MQAITSKHSGSNSSKALGESLISKESGTCKPFSFHSTKIRTKFFVQVPEKKDCHFAVLTSVIEME